MTQIAATAGEPFRSLWHQQHQNLCVVCHCMFPFKNTTLFILFINSPFAQLDSAS